MNHLLPFISFHNLFYAVHCSPIPAGIEFSTLWGRSVNVRIEELKITLRDYPLPFVEVKEAKIFGRLLGAERLGSHRGLLILQ